MGEDSNNHRRIFDGGDDLQGAAAVSARMSWVRLLKLVFDIDHCGDMTIWVVPSLYELFSCNTTWPAPLRLSRSLAIAGRVI
jgi:hypothetical protein